MHIETVKDMHIDSFLNTGNYWINSTINFGSTSLNFLSLLLKIFRTLSTIIKIVVGWEMTSTITSVGESTRADTFLDLIFNYFSLWYLLLCSKSQNGQIIF